MGFLLCLSWGCSLRRDGSEVTKRKLIFDGRVSGIITAEEFRINGFCFPGTRHKDSAVYAMEMLAGAVPGDEVCLMVLDVRDVFYGTPLRHQELKHRVVKLTCASGPSISATYSTPSLHTVFGSMTL
eukprot:5438944-Amphidinium_carterae.1